MFGYPRTLLLTLGVTVGLAELICVNRPTLLGGEPTEPGKKEQGDRKAESLPPGAIARLGTAQLREVGSGPLTFLSDGRTLATTRLDGKQGQVIFWDVKTAKEIRHLEGHLIVDFAPDRKMLASRAEMKGKAIRVLDLGTGKEISQVTSTGAYNWNRDFCFSPDGRYLAVWGGTSLNRDDDPPLRLCEVASGNEVRQFPLRVLLQSAVFSPDGKMLATAKFLGGNRKPIQLWDVASAKKLLDLNVDGIENSFQATALSFSPDGDTVASAGCSPAVCLWDVHTGKQRWRIEHLDHTTAVSSTFSPNGRMMAVGNGTPPKGTEGTVYFIEAATGQERCRFRGHLGNVWSVAFSPDGLLLASAGNDGAPLVWDVTGRILGAGKRVPPFTDKELDAAWSDLGSADAAKAWQAILALAARPEQAVSLLKERLPANQPSDAKRLAGLLADLESEAFDTREKACKELAALGHLAGPALRKVLESRPSVDVRMRVEKLLGQYGQGGILTEELRCLRALEVLEYAATPEAKKLLEAEAEGATQSQLTQGAKAALDRLAKRPLAKP